MASDAAKKSQSAVTMADRFSKDKPLVVAGLNPITLYCMWQLMGGFVRNNVRTHFGQGIFESFGSVYAPMFERGATLLVFWLILFWMYRRKISLRL